MLNPADHLRRALETRRTARTAAAWARRAERRNPSRTRALVTDAAAIAYVYARDQVRLARELVRDVTGPRHVLRQARLELAAAAAAVAL